MRVTLCLNISTDVVYERLVASLEMTTCSAPFCSTWTILLVAAAYALDDDYDIALLPGKGIHLVSHLKKENVVSLSLLYKQLQFFYISETWANVGFTWSCAYLLTCNKITRLF